jgi:hypothetical protein
MTEGDTLVLSAAHVRRGPVKLTNLSPLVPANFVPGNPDRAYGPGLRYSRGVYATNLFT